MNDLELVGFKFNEYDLCAANRTIQAQQHTIKFHVDDILSSRMKKTMNGDFHRWRNKIYIDLKEVEVTRGPRHKFLRITIYSGLEIPVVLY